MDKNKMILYGAAAAFVVLVICMFFTGSEERNPRRGRRTRSSRFRTATHRK